MQQKISFKLLPAEASDESIIKKRIASTCGKKEKSYYRLSPAEKINRCQG